MSAHREAMARYWRRIAQAPQFGPTPLECEPFLPSAAEVMQRVDCARRKECLTYAVQSRWRAFTCAACEVRETVPRAEAPTHVGFDGPYPDATTGGQ